ncbi:MAG: SDR family oxidoreductase [Polyangiaceae bacterium]|nr:SDR family oxidoreductase [Polyangiaceae bacterium]
MPRSNLNNSWALVTGGGTRVGAVIARELADAGYSVLVHYCTNRRGADSVSNSIRESGRRAEVVQANLIHRDDVLRLASTTSEIAAGELGLLVHNAACFERRDTSTLLSTPDDESWNRAMALNVTAPYMLTTALAKELKRKRGCVVAIACTSAFHPWPSYLAYSVSKAALVHLVKGLSVAMAPDVRVNAVAPGTVMLPEECQEIEKERLLSKIPLRRIGDPADVARAVRFIAENDYITGHTIVIDGGRVQA